MASPSTPLAGVREQQLELFDRADLLPYDERVPDASEIDPEAVQAIEAELRIFLNPQRDMTVRARPMALGDYLKLRGWGPGQRVDLDAAGYLVERPDMGPPNQKGFDFFIAWLPKANFEQFYERLGSPNS